jgi:O-antigen/teichoic acid export membrane protein
MIRNIIPDIFKSPLIKGGSIITFGNVTEYVLRFIRNIILVRILAPEHFGLIATTLAIVGTCEIIGEVGIRQAVVQNKKGAGSSFLNIAFWLSVIRSSGLFLILFFATPMIANFYQQPQLQAILRVAAVVIFLRGLVSPGLYVLQKNMKFLRWVMVMQGAALIGVLTAILSAFILRNVWALVLAYVTEALVLCILSYSLCPFMPSFRINFKDGKELLTFARNMFGIPFFTFIFLKGDIFVIGKMLSMEQLGIYSLAKSLAELPMLFLTKVITTVILPVFSKIQDDKERLWTEMIKVTRVMVFVGIPLFTFLAIYSKPVLTLIYGQKYALVALPFSIICFYSLFRTLGTIFMQVFLSIGKPQFQRTSAIIRAVVMMSLIYIFIKMYGLTGASLVLLIAVWTSFLLQINYIKKTIGFNMRQYFGSWWQGIVVSIILTIPSINYLLFFSRSFTQDFVIGIIIFSTAFIIGIFKFNVLSVRSNI